MRQKSWDLQIGETLHIVRFEHGRFLKKHRTLQIDGHEAIPENWRVYSGKNTVLEFPFRWRSYSLTVIKIIHKRKTEFDLLLDGVSVETGGKPDLLALSEPKTTWEKVKDVIFWLALIVLWRISVSLFFRR